MLSVTPRQLVSLPWRWRGPTSRRDEHGNEWWEITVQDLPDFFVAATSREEAVSEAASALEAFLASYVERGEEAPLPDGVTIAAQPQYEVHPRLDPQPA